MYDSAVVAMLLQFMLYILYIYTLPAIFHNIGINNIVDPLLADNTIILVMTSAATYQDVKCPHCGHRVVEAHLRPECGWTLQSWNRELKCTHENCAKPSWICLPCRSTFKTRKSRDDHGKYSSTKHAERLAEYNRELAKSVTKDEIDDDDDAFPTISDVDENSLVTNENNQTIKTMPKEKDTDDWILRYQKREAANGKEIGLPVLSLEDMKTKAGFDSKSKSPSFYWAEHKKPGSGMKFLVAQAWDKNEEDVTDGEAEFTLNICSLLLKLTAQERELFAECMLQAVNSNVPELTVFNVTRAPCSTKDFENYYLGKKGSKTSKAVIPNLPIPVPKTTSDGSHAYNRLSDVIANLLASGTPIDFFHYDANLILCKEPNNVSQTQVGRELYMQLSLNEEKDGEFVLKLHIREWCDDFDPNNTKASRNQVWAYTNTICAPSTEHRGRNTFFMAIAGKGDDHSEVQEIFRDEMEVLSSQGMTFYVGIAKRLIKAKAVKLCICVDRPERTSMFQVGDHNGTFSTAWGYAVAVDGACKDNHLPSCPLHRKLRLKRICKGADKDDCSLPVDTSRMDPTDDIQFQRSSFSLTSETSEASTDDEEREDASEVSNNCSVQPAIVPPSTHSCHCSDWKIQSITSAAPSDWPTKFDDRPGAPKAPKGREITGEPPKTVRLVTIKLTVPWLKQAIRFAHHNMKTSPPGARNRNSRYWNKKHLFAYMRSCAFTSKIMNAVYESAKNLDADPPSMPATWYPDDVLKLCHYAPMHTIFLREVRSNYDLAAKWMKSYELLATFGKQANLYLKDIQKLRCRQYFDAQPLATSTWGTGVWVSENYHFWARSQKFFALMPAIQKSNKFVGNDMYQTEKKAIMRFAMAAHACISRLMSFEREVLFLDEYIMTYMDTLYELQALLESIAKASDDKEEDDDDGDELFTSNGGKNKRKRTSTNGGDKEDEDYGEGGELICTGGKNKKKGTSTNGRSGSSKKKFKAKKPFVKSTSLGLLTAGSEAHRYFGPAHLYWEGDFAGERGIVDMKPLMSIKRSNADWQTISMRKHSQLEKINMLRNQLTPEEPSRALEGTLKVYESKERAKEVVADNMPLSGLLDNKDGCVWIAYRPKDQQSDSRSAITLLKIAFNDKEGELVGGMCWCAPIYIKEDDAPRFGSRIQIDLISEQYVLMLPRLVDDESYNQSNSETWKYQNSYYAIGNRWTERVDSGAFIPAELNIDVFNEWL